MNDKAKYTEVTHEQNTRIQEIRMLFSNAYDSIEKTCKSSRETSLAITSPFYHIVAPEFAVYFPSTTLATFFSYMLE